MLPARMRVRRAWRVSACEDCPAGVGRSAAKRLPLQIRPVCPRPAPAAGRGRPRPAHVGSFMDCNRGSASRRAVLSRVRYPTALVVGAARVWACARTGKGHRQDLAGLKAATWERALCWWTGIGGRSGSSSSMRTRARRVYWSAPANRARCTSMSGAVRRCRRPRTVRLTTAGPTARVPRSCGRCAHPDGAARISTGHDRRPAAVRSGHRPH